MDWIIGFLLQKWETISWRFKSKWVLHSMKTVGVNCHIDGSGVFSSSHISLGDNVFIGAGCTFVSSVAYIRIGNDVMIAPNVKIVTGNHRTDIQDIRMINVVEKRPEDDQDVIIEDDCWIGMNAIILKGVRIGTGSIIGAGTILTKSVPPYSIVYSHHDLIVKNRF